MRNTFLSTPSTKAPSVYQAIDEGQEEDTSWISQRAELRDDDIPDSHHENFPPPDPHEANKEQYDDPRRSSTVSPRVKLLLNREFVFQSSKMPFYNSLEMRLASPRIELPVDGTNRPPSFLRPPSFNEASRDEIEAPRVVHDVEVPKGVQDAKVTKVVQDVKVSKGVHDVNVPKVVQEVKVQKVVEKAKVQKVVEYVKVQKVVEDVTDTMSVTSLFYDDYSAAPTRSGTEVDVLHEQDHDDETEMDAYSVGHSVFSRHRVQLIHKTGSVETSFPEDPNKWLDASSVVGDEHLFTSATIESREVDPPKEQGDADTFLDRLASHTVSEEGSYHDQLVWQSHDQTETLVENGSAFDKSKQIGRVLSSPFDDLNDDEEDMDEHGNDIAMDQLFPSDPLWTIRREMEKQDMMNDPSNEGGQSYDDVEDAFPNDPFFDQRAHENVHSIHDSNNTSIKKSQDEESTKNATIAEFQGPLPYVDVGNKVTREIGRDGQDHKEIRHNERNGVAGAKNPFDSTAFNPFAGIQDEDEDDTAAEYDYSRDEESCALDHDVYETVHAHDDSNKDPTLEIPVNVTNPFASYDDDSLLNLESNSKDTNGSDDQIVETEKTITTKYINPFDDLSSTDLTSGATKTTVASYINPFDDSQEDECHTNKNGTVKKSTNPFDTFDDDMSLDRNVNHPRDPVKNSPIVADEHVVDKALSQHDQKKSTTSSVRNGDKATNLYTMVMMRSGPNKNDSKPKSSLSDSKVVPQDTLDSKDKSKLEHKSPNNSKRSQSRTVLPASNEDNTLVVDDIFNQALLPPSTQGGPVLDDSDEDDCYIEDDDDPHGVDNDSDLSDNSDTYEDGGDAAGVYHDDESHSQGEPWQSHLYTSKYDERSKQEGSVQSVVTADSKESSDTYCVPVPKRDVPKQLPHSTKNQVIVTRNLTVDYDDVSVASDRDAYDAFMRDTGKHNQYDSTVSVGESDQQTCFDEEGHPDSEALSCYDDDDDAQTYGDDGTVGGLKVLGCLHCSALEEEMMILKAQHQTELLERDLQDEDVLNNMMLMREYIEHLESDPSLPRLSHHQFAESRSRSNSVTEVEIEKTLSETSKERDDKTTNFQLFELKARVRFLEEENRRLQYEQSHAATADTQALMVRIQELENEREENLKTIAVNDELKSRIQELENELEKSKADTDQELKRRIHDLEAQLELSKQESRDDLKHQIDELAEERDLLCTKIEAQEASVALMTEEENELRKLVQRLENELQLVKLEKESETGSSPFPEELMSSLL